MFNTLFKCLYKFILQIKEIYKKKIDILRSTVLSIIHKWNGIGSISTVGRIGSLKGDFNMRDC